MRILITNILLYSQTGTEMYVRDLAIGLLKRGHFPVVFSPQLGPLADELRAASVPVADRLDQIAEAPDVVHGHHSMETMMALLHFPHAPGIFVCHDAAAWHDTPPITQRLRCYIAVDLACRERLVSQHGLPPDQVSIVQNAVDLDRFRLRQPLPPKPENALLISNYVTPDQAEIVSQACRRHGIALRCVGRHLGGSHQRPEQLLPAHDLVFAKGRCAWEALASGTAVVVCDSSGLGSMVTSSNVEQLRLWNFGRRLLQRPISREAILQEISHYDAEDARRAADYVRSIAGTEQQLDQLLAIYSDVIAWKDRLETIDRVEELKSAARFLHWCALTRGLQPGPEPEAPAPEPPRKKRRWWSRRR